MRKLKAEERRLWDFVTRNVTPLRDRHPSDDASDDHQAVTSPKKVSRAPPPQSQPLPLPKHTPAQTHNKPLHVGKPVDLDGSTAKKLKKGQLPCDAKLDLHGLTLAQAHSALISFMRHQSERGARCVLVITGKGSSNADHPAKPGGRIKAELVHWLNAQPLRPFILAVTEAPARQGGSGAVYVLLKRRERMRA